MATALGILGADGTRPHTLRFLAPAAPTPPLLVTRCKGFVSDYGGMTTPIILFGGKGGVGKTTLAAATAWRLASDARRVLLVSTDPAHSTGDLLGTTLGTEPTSVDSWLSAMEIDADAHARAYVDAIREDAEEVVSPEVRPALERHLRLAAQAPGTAESALFDRFAEVMAWAGRDYDHIVFDTAPTGHTLRLLALPDMLSAWIEGLARQRQRVTKLESMWRSMAGVSEPERDDRVLARLRRRAHRFGEARRLLREQAIFNPVLIPERLAVDETRRLLDVLAEIELPVGRLFVNRVLPEAGGDNYWRERLDQQADYLADIRERFGGHVIEIVRQAPRDVADRARLEALASELTMP